MPPTVSDLNRELARRINEEALRNPQSPYANKFVGIANGQVVVVADDLDGMIQRLRQIEPDPKKACCVEASRDYGIVEEIFRRIGTTNKTVVEFGTSYGISTLYLAAAVADNGVGHVYGSEMSETKIDDSAASYLGDIPGLRRLNVSRTAMTPAGVARLQTFLPHCAITADDLRGKPRR